MPAGSDFGRVLANGAVIPFGFPKEPIKAGESENLDARLHVDGWK